MFADDADAEGQLRLKGWLGITRAAAAAPARAARRQTGNSRRGPARDHRRRGLRRFSGGSPHLGAVVGPPDEGKALGFRALDMSHVAKACREISRSAWRSSCAQDASNLWSLMVLQVRVKGSSGCFCGGFCGAGAGAAHFGGEGAAAAAAKDPARGFGSGGGRGAPVHAWRAQG